MKNKYEIRGEVTAIFLRSKKYGDVETLISTSKLARANDFPMTYYISRNLKTKALYVLGNMSRKVGMNHKKILLHRWLTDAPVDMDVDHKNHDTLNNTDENLRVTTKSENQQNRKGAQKNSKSGIRGVFWHNRDRKWQVRIKINGKILYIGSFTDIKKAENASIAAKIKHHPYSQEVIKQVGTSAVAD